jgi:glycosyltransferase involved in cell wall biosynthesis
MENKPFFSIITICKNAEDLIEKTVKSLLQQTFCSYQYIVIDGNSSDETVNRVKSLLHQFDKLNYVIISEIDGGISHAMNKGLSYANGRLIFYLHAGDAFKDNSILARVHSEFHIYSWDWAVGSLDVVSTDDRVLHRYNPLPYSRHKEILFQNKIPHQAVFLNTIILKEVGGFDEDLTQAMDYDLWLRLLFRKGLAYHSLEFTVAIFLEGGTSMKIVQLFTMLHKSRAKLKKTGLNISLISSIKLYSIISIFLFYFRIKGFFIKLINL